MIYCRVMFLMDKVCLEDPKLIKLYKLSRDTSAYVFPGILNECVMLNFSRNAWGECSSLLQMDEKNQAFLAWYVEDLIVYKRVIVFDERRKQKSEKIKTFCIPLTRRTLPFSAMYHLMYFADFPPKIFLFFLRLPEELHIVLRRWGETFNTL